jgi:transmembrane sensor
MSTDDPTSQAINWFTRMREDDLTVADRKRFDEWLAESPVHMREYLQIVDVWGSLHAREQWPAQTSGELLEEIRRASDASADSYAGTRGKPSTPSRKELFRRPMFLSAAAGILLCITAAIIWQASRLPTYATARGEQRSVVLADGSIVQLNTLSKLTVRFDKQHREVELLRGEAFFRVAPNATRPFEVLTPFARMRALGTEFNVYNHAGGTRVAVLEGKVRVVAGRKSVDLSPEQAADVAPHGSVELVAPVQARPVAQTATAWIQRRIILDNDRIDMALIEFNRYNVLQIQIENAELAKVRISGAFNADEPAAFLRYLEKVHRTDVEQLEKNFVVLR